MRPAENAGPSTPLRSARDDKSREGGGREGGFRPEVEIEIVGEAVGGGEVDGTHRTVPTIANVRQLWATHYKRAPLSE